ncbi:hypothetical protein ACH35V_38225 [Actinomadura sp. 1N219]|uniref:hypothetical protein n=1 Tax=Actinomadura sp. 1N219 TaxID=3375152 RepID=UPI0037995FB7
MTMRRMFMMAAGAVIPVAVIALLFDNQWVVDAIRESDFEYDEGIGPLVSLSQVLAWRFTPATGMEWSFVLVNDFAVLLFFVLLGLLVVGGARIIDPNRGPLGAVIVGWWAAILAGAISGLVYGPLAHLTLDFTSPSRIIFSSISQGATAGAVFGWLAGLGALGGFVISGSRTGAQQPGAQQPFGGQPPFQQRPPFAPQQPGMPMQQQPMPQQGMPPQQQMQQPPMPQQMQPGMPQQQMQPHPSAVPYVPPQSQPQQQPPWGAAPVPQQPGSPVPQQFGAPPVPPQQPAAPAAPAAGTAEPETAADDPEPAEPEAESRGESGAEPEPPVDTPEDDDDLDLADRTIVDRGRTDD